jgi:acyl-CoA reductase-like NAD-dependent aldehyde dehydrogenase
VSTTKTSTRAGSRTATRGKASITRAARAQDELAELPAWTPTKLSVRKAYKMYVGGAFVRSESGRYIQVDETKARGETGTRENVPRGSRKDTRDAVKAAMAGFHTWSSRSAANRGQILYRLAEMLEARKDELALSLERAGLDTGEARREVAATIDRTVAYAGWTDKFHSLLSSLNPVAGPHFDFTSPEPMGVVVIVAPARPALLGLVGSILPVIASGNACIVLASEEDPRTAIALSECLATSDLPGGVVNVLTGYVDEMLPHLARHFDVQALDLHGVAPELAKQAQEHAAEAVKRVRTRNLSVDEWFDAARCESLRWIDTFVELKTIWHPSGG